MNSSNVDLYKGTTVKTFCCEKKRNENGIILGENCKPSHTGQCFVTFTDMDNNSNSQNNMRGHKFRCYNYDKKKGHINVTTEPTRHSDSEQREKCDYVTGVVGKVQNTLHTLK